MKTLFDKDKIDADQLGVVLLSHGMLAEGVYNSAKLVMGEFPNVAYVCLEEGDDPEAYKAALAPTFTAFPSGVIYLIDLLGGTPCHVVLQYCNEHGIKVDALTGLNLAMFIELISMRFSSNEIDVNELLNRVFEGMKNVGEIL